jgi:hypothetical protein
MPYLSAAVRGLSNGNAMPQEFSAASRRNFISPASAGTFTMGCDFNLGSGQTVSL